MRYRATHPTGPYHLRSARCYQTRFKTMCFGENAAPSAPVCKFCGTAQARLAPFHRCMTAACPPRDRRATAASPPRHRHATAARPTRSEAPPQADAGWTIWRSYDELPEPLRRRVDRAHGPKILSVLRTAWPEADVALFDGAGGEVALGRQSSATVAVPSV